ncbi:MAG: PAS domain S-box protein [Bacteroidetes bacterium]|nr:PAS domain S-box protein [Bacteroidota bacterium]
MKSFIYSVRSRLTILVLLAVIPIIILIIYIFQEEYKNEKKKIKEKTIEFTNLISLEEEQLIRNTREFVIIMSHLWESSEKNIIYNQSFFNHILNKHFHRYSNFGIVNLNGDLIISAIPVKTSINLADHIFYQRTLKSSGFTIGDYKIDTITKKPVIYFSYPIWDNSGKIKAIFFAAVDLKWLTQFEFKILKQLPNNSKLAKIDSKGKILVYLPNSNNLFGKTLPEIKLINAELSKGIELFEAKDEKGVNQLYSVSQIHSGLHNIKVFVVYSIPINIAFSEINKNLIFNSIILIATIVLVLLIIWIGGHYLILRRVKVLVNMAKSMEKGQLKIRSGILYHKGEIGKLAQALDEMADSLFKHEEMINNIAIKLSESEKRYRELFENANDIVYTHDLSGKITSINKAGELVTGFSRSELLNMKIEQIIKQEYIDLVQQITDEKLLDGKSAVYEIEITNKQGISIPIEVSKRPIYEGNNLVGIQAISRDITRRKRYEKELIEAKEKAEEMNRLKSSFLANMSHELRTPMNGIIGFSQILLTEDNIGSIREVSDLIYKSSKRLMHTLNSILDLSRIISGEVKLQNNFFDIIELVNECMDHFIVEAKKKNLEINLDSVYDYLMMFSDRRMIGDVLNNLINNAIKFTDSGSITVKVYKEKINNGDFVFVDVIDTGIGIDEKNYNLLFDEFRQVSEGLNRNFEGTGLGLTISKKYVEILGGIISVESKIDVGSKFTIKFPLIPSDESETKITEIENELTDTAEPSYSPNKTPYPQLLYVEDDDVSIKLVKRILKNIFEVDEVINAQQAIQNVKTKLYTLILVDINLGKEKNGIDVTKEIRKMPDYKDTPIIALTAFAMHGDREEFLEGGCSDYISKPFEPDELLRIIRKYV